MPWVTGCARLCTPVTRLHCPETLLTKASLFTTKEVSPARDPRSQDAPWVQTSYLSLDVGGSEKWVLLSQVVLSRPKHKKGHLCSQTSKGNFILCAHKAPCAMWQPQNTQTLPAAPEKPKCRRHSESPPSVSVTPSLSTARPIPRDQVSWRAGSWGQPRDEVQAPSTAALRGSGDSVYENKGTGDFHA